MTNWRLRIMICHQILNKISPEKQIFLGREHFKKAAFKMEIYFLWEVRNSGSLLSYKYLVSFRFAQQYNSKEKQQQNLIKQLE